MKFLKISLLFLLLPFLVWADFFSTKRQAHEEKKDLILFFVHSGHTENFAIIEKELLQNPVFLEKIQKEYVVLVLDDQLRPKEKNMFAQDELESLRKYYQVKHVPTFLLADAEGRAWGVFKGFVKKELASFYLKQIENFKKQKEKRDGFLQEAETVEGDQKALLYSQLVAYLQENKILMGYAHMMAELLELDVDNHLGIREKYEALFQEEVSRTLLIRDYGGLLKFSDAFLKTPELSKEGKQEWWLQKAFAYQGLHQMKDALDATRAALQIAPRSDRADWISFQIEELQILHLRMEE